MHNKNLNIFILAGGLGTRLKSVVSDVPKPMAPICDKPFLAYQINEIKKYFPSSKIYLLTYYLSEIIENYFKKDASIIILKEQKLLGTGGSIKNAINFLNLDVNDSLLILNGDTYIKPDFNNLVSNFNEIVILASFQEDCQRYGTLLINNGKIVRFVEKEAGLKNSYINAGCYYFNNLIFFHNIQEEIFAIEDKFKEYLLNDTIEILRYNDIFIDIGIPEDYKKMIDYVESHEN